MVLTQLVLLVLTQSFIQKRQYTKLSPQFFGHLCSRLDIFRSHNSRFIQVHQRSVPLGGGINGDRYFKSRHDNWGEGLWVNNLGLGFILIPGKLVLLIFQD